MSKLSWKPKLNKAEGTYCSPACGGRCKLAEHLKAKENASALCAKLGPRWQPYVWENLGWHWKVWLPVTDRTRYSLNTPRIDLYPHYKGDTLLAMTASLEAYGSQRVGRPVRGARRAIFALCERLETEICDADTALLAIRSGLR